MKRYVKIAENFQLRETKTMQVEQQTGGAKNCFVTPRQFKSVPADES